MRVLLLGVLLLFGCAPTERYVNPIAKNIDSVVMVMVPVIDGDVVKIVQGAGSFISERGHILTCAHLFRRQEIPTEAIVVTYFNTEYMAEVLHVDANRDLALIKIEEITKPLKIAYPGTLKVGQEVIALGHPFGFTWTATNGIISALNTDYIQYNALQTNTAVSPGNSGGPLLNLKGDIVGVNVGIFSPSKEVPIQVGLNFAVECGQIYEFLTKFRGLLE